MAPAISGRSTVAPASPLPALTPDQIDLIADELQWLLRRLLRQMRRLPPPSMVEDRLS
jgi:hypothetical protein